MLRKLSFVLIPFVVTALIFCGGAPPASGNGAGGSGGSSSSSSGSGAGGPCPSGADYYDPPSNRITVEMDLSTCVGLSNSAAASCVGALLADPLSSFAPINSAPTCRLKPDTWTPFVDHGPPTIKYGSETAAAPVFVQDFQRLPAVQLVAIGIAGMTASQVFDAEQSAFAPLRSAQVYPQDQHQAVIVPFAGTTGPVLVAGFGFAGLANP
jgi:hypothetical protein